MRLRAGMPLSDRIVYDTLARLVTERGENVISQREIADAAQLSLRACQYALKRLRHEGRIAGDFESGIGYRYRIAAVTSEFPKEDYGRLLRGR